ncbi:MAG: GNAT family N-acetyltransferase [Burkholderiaceae bacterium]|nr:GNAT family N-acetyltransferase [Burkholderiaceae bacterium]MDH5208304.1 GNAT family N-acetyltransferase [Burkholderiaceae bacterium]
MPVLVPMSEADYAAFAESTVPAYAADKVASGQWAQEQALELARKALTDLLPDGLRTAGHYLYTIQDDLSQPVGRLWIAVQARGDGRVAYVYEVAIRPEHRRQGHAARALRAAEHEARTLGLSGIALHVFGHNPGAIAMYEKLGYRMTNINMFKALA